VWPFFEQLAFAALDCGRNELASVCIDRLAKRFPGSPRVTVLKGMLLEGSGKLDDARELYEKALAEDDSSVVRFVF
jgi:Flp pilus assembly protein TadD